VPVEDDVERMVDHAVVLDAHRDCPLRCRGIWSYAGAVPIETTAMKKVLRRRTGSGRFADRRDAGRALAELLAAYRGHTDVLVLGLARGGIPVAGR
jgi:hypothetical protein